MEHILPFNGKYLIFCWKNHNIVSMHISISRLPWYFFQLREYSVNCVVRKCMEMILIKLYFFLVFSSISMRLRHQTIDWYKLLQVSGRPQRSRNLSILWFFSFSVQYFCNSRGWDLFSLRKVGFYKLHWLRLQLPHDKYPPGLLGGNQNYEIIQQAWSTAKRCRFESQTQLQRRLTTPIVRSHLETVSFIIHSLKGYVPISVMPRDKTR